MSNVQVRLQRLERILEISRELTSTVSLEPLLHQIVKVAAELSGSQATSILLLDARTGELRFRAADDDPAGQLSSPTPTPSPVTTRSWGSGLVLRPTPCSRSLSRSKTGALGFWKRSTNKKEAHLTRRMWRY